MANNTIQIKRSPTTAIPSSLNPGELAYSNATGGTGVLYIGSTDGGTVVPIGGVRNPGILTANQALVSNSTLGINRVISANVEVLNTLYANGSTGTSGWVLFSGGGTTNTYWASAGSVGVNTAAQYTWTNTQTFQLAVTIGANLIFDNTSIRWVGNTTTSPTITIANTGAITVGNNSTTQITSSITLANSIAVAAITPLTGLFGNSTVTTAPQIVVQNTAGSSVINATTVATTLVLANVSGTYVNVSGQVNTATLYVSTSANVSTFFIANSSGITTTANASLSGGVLTTNSTLVNSTVAVNATAFITTGNANAANFYAGANTVLNATNLLWTGNTTTSPTITLANTGSFTIGNSSTTQITSIISVANSSGNVQITPTSISGNGANITSVNAIALGGSAAADIYAAGYTPDELYAKIKASDIVADELIIEHDGAGDRWVHISYDQNKTEQRGYCEIGVLTDKGTVCQSDGFMAFKNA